METSRERAASDTKEAERDMARCVWIVENWNVPERAAQRTEIT
jgi:hypothetical protein